MDPQLRALLQWLLRCAVTLVLPFALLNAALIGGQWLWHRGDRAELQLLEASLGIEKQRIALLEARLGEMTASLGESKQGAARLQAEIAVIESRYASGIPESEFHDYAEKVARYNAAAQTHNSSVERFESVRGEYEATIAAYNARVEQANELAKSAGTTWYLLPVPGGSRHAQAPSK